MSLVVETGAGLSNAESFVSVAEMDAYFVAFGVPSSYALKTEAEKEILLRVATQYLVAQYRGKWRGAQSTQEQALPWPRIGVIDDEGWGIDSNVVPKPLKEASYELVKRLLTKELLPDRADGGTVQSTSVSLGSLSESISYFSGATGLPEFTLVERLLGGLIHYSRGVVKPLRRA